MPRHELDPFALFFGAIFCGLGVACAQVAVIVPFVGRYGWDRDELYFLSAPHPAGRGSASHSLSYSSSPISSGRRSTTG